MERMIEGIIWLSNENRPIVFKRLGLQKQHSLVIKAIASSKFEVCKKLRIYLEQNVLLLGDYRNVLDKKEVEFGEALEQCLSYLKNEQIDFVIKTDNFKVQYLVQETFSTVDVLL